MKKLFLVDISSLIFRAFFAVRPLTAPSGLPTNAIYGVLSMLIKLLKEEKPDYVVVCYDRKEPSFRKQIYPEYKAHRTEMPEDLVPQMPVIKKLIDLLGIPAIEVPDFEADDIIGTMVKVGRKRNLEVFIMSSDKDFGQVIQPHVYLFDSMKNEKIDGEGVLKKWGVRPDQFIDYLSLVGDTSDNIPGVTGIGPKGAQNLLNDFESLDGIYANIEKIKSESLRKNLALGKEDAYLSKKLVRIVDDVPIQKEFEEFHPKEMQKEKLRMLLQDLNFKSFEKALFDSENENKNFATSTEQSLEQPTVAKTNYINSEHEIKDLAKVVPPNSELWFMSASHGVYIGLDNKLIKLKGELCDLGIVSKQLQVRWKGFDVKSFWHSMNAIAPEVAWDSMLAAYVLKPGEKLEFQSVHSWLCGKVLPEMASAEELFFAEQEVASRLEKELEKTDLRKVYYDLELPLAPILYLMEKKGIRLDKQLLEIQGKELSGEIKSLETNIFELAQTQFNIASPKQLSQVLFGNLKLTSYKKTKTGDSTDNEVLEKLRKEHPIAEELLKYRELTKLKSTYVDSLPLLVKADGRIHTTFNQALTTTGRLSSTEPNLQNIPIKTERGARVRKAFVAEEGNLLLSVDYSQIELRILAHYSSDPNLIKSFEQDLDIHAATAAEVFNVSLQDVTSEMRRTAKAINFGIAYGQGAFGLAENLGIPRGEAQEIIKKYFARFSYVKTYIEEMIEVAKKQGFVETIYGRRRYIHELKSNNVMIRKFGERAAINAPIQGSASDIVKKSMIEVVRVTNLDLLLQVHDELIFEGKESLIHEEKNKIVKLMESVVSLKVPLKVNAAVGKNWDEAH